MRSKNCIKSKDSTILNKLSLSAVLICISVFILWSILLFQKYYYFGFRDWDLAFFAQAIWNMKTNFSQFSSLFEVNFFSNHSNFIAILCIPIFTIFEHPMTLVVLKIASYVSAAYILFHIGKDKIGHKLAILCMVLYLFYPPNIFAIAYEFHFESLSPVFLVYLYYCFIKEKYLNFLITALLTISLKENMPLIIASFGIYGFIAKKKGRFKWGVIPILLGFISFYLLTSVIIPHFSGSSTHGYIGFFKQYGSSPIEIVLSIITNPFQLISVFTTPQNLNYFSEYFSSLLFLPFFSPHIIFLCLPLILQHLLASSFQSHTIYYHYSISIAPFVFIALINSLAFLKLTIRKSAFTAIVVLIILLSIFNLNAHKNRIKSRLAYQNDYLHQYRQKFMKQIPNDAEVIASFDYLAPLSMRKYLYGFHKVYNSLYQQRLKPFITPPNVDYALIDFKDPWLLADFYQNPEQISTRLQNFFKRNKWNIRGAAENIILLNKQTKNKDFTLVDQSKSPFQLFTKKPILSIDQKLELLNLGFKEDITSNSSIPMIFYWKSTQKINTLYLVLFQIKKEGTIIHTTQHNIGYLVYPTSIWEKDTYTKEVYSIVMPKLEKGHYTLEAQFINMNNKKIAVLKNQSLESVNNNTFILKQFTIK